MWVVTSKFESHSGYKEAQLFFLSLIHDCICRKVLKSTHENITTLLALKSYWSSHEALNKHFPTSFHYQTLILILNIFYFNALKSKCDFDSDRRLSFTPYPKPQEKPVYLCQYF